MKREAKVILEEQRNRRLPTGSDSLSIAVVKHKLA